MEGLTHSGIYSMILGNLFYIQKSLLLMLIYYIDKGVAKNLTKTILLPLVTRAIYEGKKIKLSF